LRFYRIVMPLNPIVFLVGRKKLCLFWKKKSIWSSV
jgi:hypothetical protein